MSKTNLRYSQLERILTFSLIGDTAAFILFLIAAGAGIIWLKVITIILTLACSLLAIGLLYYTGELLRRRSFWLTTGFAAIFLCVLFSLLLNYPSPIQ